MIGPDGRRQKNRQRTRLRSGKIADLNGVFLTECQIFDCSEKGARLRVLEICDFPDHLKLFDDQLDTLSIAVVKWIEGNEVGVEFPIGPQGTKSDGDDHTALGGRYYAVK